MADAMEEQIKKREEEIKKHHITKELIRKRAEHNEGIISTLEELSLHQEELVSIDPILGSMCHKLKILYLQNNIIEKMENLHHMKELEYLNLALNNIQKIENLGSCEFLNKLDLTVNFVDLDVFEESILHLQPLTNLRELFLIGNPCQAKWEEGYAHYVVALLPQLAYLDGKEVVRSQRIRAAQRLPQLQVELATLAAAAREEKAAKKAAAAAEEEKKAPTAPGPPAPPPAAAAAAREGGGGAEEAKGVAGEGGGGNPDPSAEETTPHTPEVRTEMYREIAEQKAEKDARERANQPRERDHDKEQATAVRRARERESEGRIRQCNEGKLDFFFDEETKPGFLILDVAVPRHLNSSLIDVDAHPHYISVVVKGKVLRLDLPSEVRSEESKAQRSKTTGHLRIAMPKVNPRDNVIAFKALDNKEKKQKQQRHAVNTSGTAAQTSRTTYKNGGGDSVADGVKKLSLQEQMMLAGSQARQNATLEPTPNPHAVSIHGIVKHTPERGGQRECLSGNLQSAQEEQCSDQQRPRVEELS